MCRPAFTTLVHYHQPQQWQEIVARMLCPLTLWICVSVSLRFGYYGDRYILLGPSSSRLFKVNPLFVKQVEVRDDGRKGVSLYGFSEKPASTLEANWSLKNYFTIRSYSRKGFSLSLNKGSRVRIKWYAAVGGLSHTQISLIKGEKNYKRLLPANLFTIHVFDKQEDGREAEYIIEEGDKYYVGIINTNPRSIKINMKVYISSKMYDITKARSMCSTVRGICRLNVLFPSTQYVIVTTPNNGDFGEWHAQLSFVTRVIVYIAILAILIIVIILVLKFLEASDGDSYEVESPVVREVTETHPLMPQKVFRSSYGTGEDDLESGSSSSSEDLYDGKICVICYDMPRNCFFIPCGHCATCRDCAQRIVDEESKVCPICRRLIHKVRKLIIP